MADIDDEGAPEEIAPEKTATTYTRAVIIIAVVAAAFGGILFAKSLGDRVPATGETDSTSQVGGASITSVHNDALRDYQAALKTGKPIYVLFHSLS